jgi:hypothetical protein
LEGLTGRLGVPPTRDCCDDEPGPVLRNCGGGAEAGPLLCVPDPRPAPGARRDRGAVATFCGLRSRGFASPWPSGS